MFKLLQICVEGNTGSTGRLAEVLGEFVIKKGGKSVIAHGRFSRPSSSDIIKIGNKFDIYLHGFLTRIFDRHGLGSKQSTKRLIKQIREIKPDIIHLHHLHGYYINIEVLFNYLSSVNIPVIWTFHDCWSITGHCTHFEYVGCNRWENVCYKCPQKKSYPSSFFQDRSTQNFRLKKQLFNSIDNLTIVSVSNWLDNVVGKSFLSLQKRRIIYNGINLNIFRGIKIYNSVKSKFKIQDKFLILGVASPWSENKGLNDFIKLSFLLPKDTLILLVGLSKIQINSLPQNIIGIQKTENQIELSSFYASADVFINFSVEETFGLTTAEALACGTPAIVYNSTACPEIVDHNTGFVLPIGKYDLALTSIEEIKLKGRSFYEKKCIERARRLFNLEDKLKEYYNLYKETLENIK